MEIRPKTHTTDLTPRRPARGAVEGPSDRLERGRGETPGIYGPKSDLRGAEAPARAGLKAAGMALAVVAVAALCDALTGGALHRSRD